LEAHFGGKSVGVKGMDMTGNSLCAYRFIDARHQAMLEVHPPNPAEDSVTPQQRIDYDAQMLNKGKAPESRIFGAVGCYKSTLKQGVDRPLPSTVCFQSKGGYIGLTISSDDARQTTYPAVKALFDKVVARRK
jgi:hypothetical protein